MTDRWWGLIALAAQVAAFWGVWADYARRMRAGIDEPWGILALLVAVGVTVVHRTRAASGASTDRGVDSAPPIAHGTRSVGSSHGAPSLALLAGVSALMILYGATLGLAPPLVSGIIAMTAIAWTASRILLGRRMDLSLWGLLLLSLPLSSALQFYLGYPMRAATAAMAAPLLRAGGLAVERSGTVLQYGGQSIWIDAPCSGVKMLWTGFFLALALSAILRLSNWRTIGAGVAALVAIVVGNVVRSTALFYLEAGIVPGEGWYHTGVGLVAFAVTAGVIAWCVTRLGKGTAASQRPLAGRSNRCALIGHLVVCCGVALLPLFRADHGHEVAAGEFPGWPADFEGRSIVEEPLAERERLFLENFPGKVVKFSDGRRQIVLRWTNVATRDLHLSSDCFRGAGFAIEPRAAMGGEGAAGPKYSRFVAIRGGEKLLVSERIYDGRGNSYPDVSSWYWAAKLRRTQGPWWGVTIVETDNPGE